MRRSRIFMPPRNQISAAAGIPQNRSGAFSIKRPRRGGSVATQFHSDLDLLVIFCVRGVISPLLANLYFPRFLLAWNSHGHRDRLGAHVVNYADDFVICCRPGNGEAALATMRHLMTRLGLTVNEAKTRLIRIPDGSCDFLGYTIGRFHGRDGGAYIGTRPSRKAVRALLRKIHEATTP